MEDRDPIPQRDCGRFSRPSLHLRTWPGNQIPRSFSKKLRGGSSSDGPENELFIPRLATGNKEKELLRNLQ